MLVFYPRYALEIVAKHVRLAAMFLRLRRMQQRLAREPGLRDYMDQALTPVADHELDELELFTVSAGAKSAVVKARKEEQARARLAG
jgi:hypothetical protein